mmetsp:Transcript_19956/g.46344  ORF Transcript_19956/g.46344 Transcript_19956/m.46344 type:complete len:92 (+) Transcript_19956:93-368(+)
MSNGMCLEIKEHGRILYRFFAWNFVRRIHKIDHRSEFGVFRMVFLPPASRLPSPPHLLTAHVVLHSFLGTTTVLWTPFPSFDIRMTPKRLR